MVPDARFGFLVRSHMVEDDFPVCLLLIPDLYLPGSRERGKGRLTDCPGGGLLCGERVGVSAGCGARQEVDSHDGIPLSVHLLS